MSFKAFFRNHPLHFLPIIAPLLLWPWTTQGAGDDHRTYVERFSLHDFSRESNGLVRAGEVIPWKGIAEHVAADYRGDGLSIHAGAEKAVIHSAFQRLRGQASMEGLWLTSTIEADGGPERFRVIADRFGRCDLEERTVPRSGRVETQSQLVRFIREHLTEEYSTSADGVRQDFIVKERPLGQGELCLNLAVDGARTEAAPFGARFILEGSGRRIAYSRLHVVDANGQVLDARMEVPAENRLTIWVDDSAAAYPVRIDPTFSDENWISMGTFPGTDYDVKAIVADPSGNIYIGGDFSLIGDVSVRGVARWDGSEWSVLGDGLDGSVWSLALAETGELYAGGSFRNAGGVAVNQIAKWDGQTWSALGIGSNSPVWAMTTLGPNLYATGAFRNPDGQWIGGGMAKWDGNAWSGLGSGVGGGGVYALAVSGDDLYVGGNFSTAGGIPAMHIAKWDGSSWSPLGAGLGGELLHRIVFAVAVSGSDVFVGGRFTHAGGTPANNVAKWDGNEWSALGAGLDGFTGSSDAVRSLVARDGILYAGGTFTTAGGGSVSRVAMWDGAEWSGVGTGVDGSVQAMAFSASGDLYVGGAFLAAGDRAVSRIARWDGVEWGPVVPASNHFGLAGPVLAMAVAGDDLYLGGSFTTAGETRVNRVVKWDGDQWSPLGSGVDDTVRALAIMGTDLYAAGDFMKAGDVSANRIARWDGVSWQALGSGLNAPVRALLPVGSDLYVGGEFLSAGDFPSTRIAKWDGSGWSAFNSGPNGRVNALAWSGQYLYAGGAFSSAGPVPASRVARWDGVGWTGLGDGVTGGAFSEVAALAVSACGDLYAGGNFTHADGQLVNHIARWDGSEWSGLGGGVLFPPQAHPFVRSLMLFGNYLYVGGSFTLAGNVPVRHLALWDGRAWSDPEPGIAGGGLFFPAVHAISAVGDTRLYAGGSFLHAAGESSPFVVRAEFSPQIPMGVIALSRHGVVRNRAPGEVVGFLTPAKPCGVADFTFTFADGEGDLGNASFMIEGDLLRTAVMFGDETPGMISIRVRATNSAGQVVEQVITLFVGLDSYPEWLENLPPGQRGVLDDPGGFGISNLLRFAFGMDPLNPARNRLPGVSLHRIVRYGEEHAHLAISFSRPKEEVLLVYRLEASQDLILWETVPSTMTVHDDGNDKTETVRFLDPRAIDSDSVRFLRVRVKR